MHHTRIFWSLFLLMMTTSFGLAQITVDFSSNLTTGCGSLQVSFSDESTSSAGPITNWAWDLGGVNSQSQHPGRVFGTPGSYTICLTVTDSESNTETKCETAFITIFPLPEPDFSISNNNGCPPLEVFFTDESVSDGGAITEWIWGVGGSTGVVVTNDPTEIVSSTYMTADDYTVSLTIKDENDCSNTITSPDLITIHPEPEIDISITDAFSCDIPFTADIINNNISPELTYLWAFGNGQIFSGSIPPPVIYTAPGTYDVTVTVRNQNTNCRITEVFDSFIQVGYPVEISYEAPNNCQGSEVSFTDNSVEPADSVRWDFGDGNFSTETNPQHSFSQGGCFTVSLIRFTQGCPSEGEVSDCILIQSAPQATINADNPAGCTLPHTVNFSTASNTATSWAWNFADGNTSSAAQPQHTFTNFGIYPVTATITDDNGCTNIFTDTIRVVETSAQMPEDLFWGCTPYNVTLTDATITSSPIVGWDWEVYDPEGNLVFTSNLENPELSLVDTGAYNIVLTVINQQGCSSSNTIEGGIAIGMELFPDFSATPIETCIDAIVDFTDLTVGGPNFWIWNFGDGTLIEDVQNPSHEYIDTGYFDVQLFAFQYGCFSEITYEDLIHVNAPIGRAVIERNCENPFAISFLDRSFGVDSVHWDFGEPSIFTDTSTILSPTHVFSDTGCFEVIHNVFNFTTGCFDSDTIPICITDPIASFTLTNTDGCIPLEVIVANNSVHADTYQWIAPGATITGGNTANPTFTYDTPGTFGEVMLVISDVQTCQDTLVSNQPIIARGLIVDYSVDVEGGCRPLTVNFSDNSTSAFSTPLSWSWDIGNGLVTSDEESFSYTFDTIGNFRVELVVSDGNGCTGRRVFNDAIEVTQPVAEFRSDTTTCTSDTVRFVSLSTGGMLTYLWDFGDGTTGAGERPMHHYATEGIYDVCLTITNQYGCTNMTCKTDYVVVADPIADFTVDSTFAFCPPLLAQFENNSTNASYYSWNFGDNSGESDLESPPHVYTIPGSYSVQLIAGSTENCRDTLTINNLINLEGPVGAFDFVVDTSCAPMQVHFSGTSDDFYDYIWDYGNGELDTVLNAMTSDITYTYQVIDTYVPKLFLIDDSNCARAIESPDSITVSGINVNFIATDSVLCGSNATTTFVNLSQSTTPITSVEWLLNGTTEISSDELEPSVTYLNPGIYDATLFVNTEFCQDTLTKSNYIRVGSVPTVELIASDTLGCTPLVVNFDNTASSDIGEIANWIWTFGDGDTVQLSNPTHTFSEAGIFNTELTTVTEYGCTASDNITINVMESPGIRISEDRIICNGEATTLVARLLGDPNQLTYQWTAGQGLSCTNCLETTVTPATTTTYEFTATSSNGCSTTATTTVEVLATAVPIITLTADTTICVSDAIQLNVGGGEDVFSYQWDESRPGLSCYDYCFNPVANPVDATTYVVTVTNGNGCSAMDSVIINLVDQFQPLSGEDRTICQGDSVILTTGVPNLTWTNPIDLSCAYCPDPIAFPDSSFVYKMETNTDEGCLIQDSILITVLTTTDIDAGADVNLCLGSSITLNGQGIGAISWIPESSLSEPTNLQALATPSATTVYRLRATQDLCTLEDSVTVNVVEQTDIFVEEATICIGDTIQLSTTGNADFFIWSPDETLSDNEVPNPIAFPLETTTYTVVGNLTGCPADTTEVTVTVDQGPQVRVSETYFALPDLPVVLQASIDTTGDYLYSWFPSEGLSCTDCPFPVVDSAFIGQSYELLVTDLMTGCELEFTTNTQFLQACGDDLLWVPSGFSPNDDGRNEELLVYSGTLQDIKSFQIFDRWGALVFRSNDMNRGWDGTMKGERMPMGVYVYFVEAICPVNNQPILVKGDVTLVR